MLGLEFMRLHSSNFGFGNITEIISEIGKLMTKIIGRDKEAIGYFEKMSII